MRAKVEHHDIIAANRLLIRFCDFLLQEQSRWDSTTRLGNRCVHGVSAFAKQDILLSRPPFQSIPLCAGILVGREISGRDGIIRGFRSELLRILLALQDVPKTVENFKQLCAGTPGLLLLRGYPHLSFSNRDFED